MFWGNAYGMMGTVTILRFEDKGEETESRVTKTGANQERERRQRETLGQRRRSQETRTRERLGQKIGMRYVLGQRLWQPTHTRGTQRAL